MTVELDSGYVGAVLKYDLDAVQGDTIDVAATNPETGDVSTRDGLKNDDGRFVWTYPAGYSGTAEFVVTGSDDGEDKGTVHLGE
jgi:hypothetical protein